MGAASLKFSSSHFRRNVNLLNLSAHYTNSNTQVTQTTLLETDQSVCPELTSSRISENDVFWTQVLRYCQEPKFCSRLHISPRKCRRVGRRALQINQHELNQFKTVRLELTQTFEARYSSLHNAFQFDFNSEFQCLRTLLSHQSFYNCPPKVSPCKVPSISHVTWYGDSLRFFRFHHYISVEAIFPFSCPKRYSSGTTRFRLASGWRSCFVWPSSGPLPAFSSCAGNHRIRSTARRWRLASTLTDVVQLEAVLHFGGIYHDLDVVILRSV